MLYELGDGGGGGGEQPEARLQVPRDAPRPLHAGLEVPGPLELAELAADAGHDGVEVGELGAEAGGGLGLAGFSERLCLGLQPTQAGLVLFQLPLHLLQTSHSSCSEPGDTQGQDWE